MARLRAGDEDAASEVFHRFASRLIALARLQPDTRIRQKWMPSGLNATLVTDADEDLLTGGQVPNLDCSAGVRHARAARQPFVILAKGHTVYPRGVTSDASSSCRARMTSLPTQALCARPTARRYGNTAS